MIKILKMQKNKGRQILSLSKGFTYVELIVVLAIFGVMSAIVMYNYGGFQAKVDIKSLASDIALKIVGAQKSAMSGVLPLSGGYDETWKPAYGVYFDITNQPKQFIYFADIKDAAGNINMYNLASGEELETFLIKKNNFISNIDKCTISSCTPGSPINFLTITFRRPDSRAIFTDSYGLPLPSPLTGSDYIQITIKSSPRSDAATAKIKIYPSGRIQVN